MSGKTCIVTGASRGIGFHTARGLVLRGADVILIGHNRERGRDAVDRIRRAMRADRASEGGSAAFALVDLSVQDQIFEFATSFNDQHARLDVLVNNAGAFFIDRRESADGIEMTFALNHLNYFLTTNLLLDLLEETGRQRPGETARIVNVASDAHRNAKINFDDLQFEEGYRPLDAYNQSKLANLLFTYELDRHLDKEAVTVNALHPGFVNTNIGDDHWLLGPLLSVIEFFFAISPEEGAETPIYLASSPEAEGISGRYFVDKEPVRSSAASYDEAAARRLWDLSAEMTGLQ